MLLSVLGSATEMKVTDILLGNHSMFRHKILSYLIFYLQPCGLHFTFLHVTKKNYIMYTIVLGPAGLVKAASSPASTATATSVVVSS